MPAILATILWMSLAASGGVLSGIFLEKQAPAIAPPISQITNTSGSFDFFKTLKLIGILTAGGVAIHLLMKLFKIKLFGRIVK